MESAYSRCAFVACRLRRHRGGASAAGLSEKEGGGYGGKSCPSAAQERCEGRERALGTTDAPNAPNIASGA